MTSSPVVILRLSCAGTPEERCTNGVLLAIPFRNGAMALEDFERTLGAEWSVVPDGASAYRCPSCPPLTPQPWDGRHFTSPCTGIDESGCPDRASLRILLPQEGLQLGTLYPQAHAQRWMLMHGDLDCEAQPSVGLAARDEGSGVRIPISRKVAFYSLVCPPCSDRFVRRSLANPDPDHQVRLGTLFRPNLKGIS